MQRALSEPQRTNRIRVRLESRAMSVRVMESSEFEVGRSSRNANRSISVVGPRIALDQTGGRKNVFSLGVSLARD